MNQPTYSHSNIDAVDAETTTVEMPVQATPSQAAPQTKSAVPFYTTPEYLAKQQEIPPALPDFWWMRPLEIVVASVALVLGFPVMATFWILIRLGTPGPVMFRQYRIGRGGKVFAFYKFRTMYADARQRFPELYAYSYSPEELDKFQFKVTEDPRVTPQGRWMRKTSLDELPNFWNVLTGDMALVGPRPEIPEMLPYYEGEMLEKFRVRPGVTGLAQVSGRGHLYFRETVELDVENVRKRGFLFDTVVFLRTLLSVVISKGAF